MLLSAEGITVALIVVVAVVVLVKMLAGNAPGDAQFTMKVFTVPPGTDTSTCSSGSSSACSRSPASRRRRRSARRRNDPQRDIPRAILGTAIFGGIYFTVVTAIEMMAFGTGRQGRGELHRLAGARWATSVRRTSAPGSGDLITLGACVSARSRCCLACVVGASRLLFAISA